MYNSKWNSLAKSLNSTVLAFFAAIYTVGNMADAELKVEPGLSNTREVVRGWRDIVQKLHPAFVDEITSLRATMFSTPELETDLSAQVRKKRHEGQETAFRKLNAAATAKLEELDDFVSDQVDIRFKAFCERIRGAELNTLMREGQGPSQGAPNPSAHPPQRVNTFKPNESFLECRKKPFPWYSVGSTSVPSEERDAIADYINSGGAFNHVSVPTIYIKR